MSARLRALARRSALTVGVALAVVALALESGGYDVTIRNCFAIAAWWGIGVGAAAGVWPNARIPRVALACGAALAGLALVTGIWVPWADSAEKAFTEFNRVAFYLGIFALVVVAASRASAARWADGLALGIAAIAIVGLTSRLFPDLLGDRGVSSFFPGGGYLGYPLDYWNGLGIFIALGLPLLVRMATEAHSPVARALKIAPLPAVIGALYLTSSRGGFVTAAVAGLVFVALAAERLRVLVGIMFAAAGGAAAIAVLEARPSLTDGLLDADFVASQGRSAAVLIVLICIATAALYGFASRFPLRPPRIRVPRAAVAAALVLVAGGVAVANPDERLDDFKQPPSNSFALEAPDSSPGGSETEGSTIVAASASSHLLSSGGNGRWQFWSAAVDQFETTPLLGGGPGSYEAWWAQNGSLSYFTRHAHSHYLQTLGELGLVGLVLLLGFLLAPLAALRGRLRALSTYDRNVVAALAALVGGFLVALAIDWMWELPVVTAVGVAAIALMVGPATRAVTDHARPAQPGRRLGPLAARAVVVLLALGLIAGQAIALIAQDKLDVSQDRFAAADLDGARAAALDALDVQPWAASPHVQLALVEEAAGDLPAAREAIDDAIERDPTDWRLWLTAARLDEAAGLDTSAQERLDRAIELNPRSPLFARR